MYRSWMDRWKHFMVFFEFSLAPTKMVKDLPINTLFRMQYPNSLPIHKTSKSSSPTTNPFKVLTFSCVNF